MTEGGEGRGRGCVINSRVKGHDIDWAEGTRPGGGQGGGLGLGTW